MKDEQLAFPSGETECEHGMTLRDYFAAKAMLHMVKMQGMDGIYCHQHAVAQQAYKMADAMLEARK